MWCESLAAAAGRRVPESEHGGRRNSDVPDERSTVAVTPGDSDGREDVDAFRPRRERADRVATAGSSPLQVQAGANPAAHHADHPSRCSNA